MPPATPRTTDGRAGTVSETGSGTGSRAIRTSRCGSAVGAGALAVLLVEGDPEVHREVRGGRAVAEVGSRRLRLRVELGVGEQVLVDLAQRDRERLLLHVGVDERADV